MGWETLNTFNIEPIWGQAQQVKGGWTTIVSVATSGKEQRRSRWMRPLSDIAYKFDLHYPRIKDQLLAFFNARKGAYEKFWLPSFRRETYLTQGANIGTSYLYVTTTEFFTITSDLNGNFVTVRSKDNLKMNTRLVTNIDVDSGKPRLTISPALDATFDSGNFVEVTYKVRFGSDTLDEAITIYTLEAEVDFREIK